MRTQTWGKIIITVEMLLHIRVVYKTSVLKTVPFFRQPNLNNLEDF